MIFFLKIFFVFFLGLSLSANAVSPTLPFYMDASSKHLLAKTHHPLKKRRIWVGDAPVDILYFQGKGKTFIHLHQNEKTALKAAFSVMNKEGGSLITLAHKGGRTIVFHLKKRRYEFDPNRIFTKKGIKKTLARYSRYNLRAYKEVNKLSVALKRLLPKGKVIAVHNNASYSLKDYLPGHDLASDAKALNVNPKKYHRNFYLFTQYSDYKRLKSKGFNGVLQKKSPIDDGSLSVLLSRRAYICVEAAYDELRQQINMIRQA